VIIPNLDKEYPNAPLALGYNLTAVPTSNLSSSGFSWSFPGALSFFILSNDTTPATSGSLVLTLGVNLQGAFSVYVSSSNGSNVVHLKLNSVSFKLSVLESKIGKVDVLLINSAMTSFLNVLLIPSVNAWLNVEGITIPSIQSTHHSAIWRSCAVLLCSRVQSNLFAPAI